MRGSQSEREGRGVAHAHNTRLATSSPRCHLPREPCDTKGGKRGGAGWVAGWGPAGGEQCGPGLEKGASVEMLGSEFTRVSTKPSELKLQHDLCLSAARMPENG